MYRDRDHEICFDDGCLGDTDGFLGNAGINNLYLYRLENRAIHTLIAWDADNTFWGADFPIDVSWAGNKLVDKLMAVPEYSALFAEIDTLLERAPVRLLEPWKVRARMRQYVALGRAPALFTAHLIYALQLEQLVAELPLHR